MNYKNKLMGLSLILLAVFSACSDEMENGGRDSDTDDHHIIFAIDTRSLDARTRVNDSLSDVTGSYEANSVEIQGKPDKKTVYLTVEVSNGLLGDDQPLTRGTQVMGAAQVDRFSVSAAILDASAFESETLDMTCNMEVAKNNASSVWTTGTPYYWPTGKKLTSLVQYSYNSRNLTIPKGNSVRSTKPFYEVPERVVDQEDLTMVNSYKVGETSNVPIWSGRVLTAVKFKMGDNIPAYAVESIFLRGVRYKGYHNWQAHGSGILSQNPDADTQGFTLDFSNGKGVIENTETEFTEEGETSFMMSQTFGDDSETRLEVTLEANGVGQTISAKLKDLANTYGLSVWSLTITTTYKTSLNQDVELELNKGVFVASGTDAIVYVKSNCGWECTLSGSSGITGNTASTLCKPTMKGSTNGVQSDSFDNENTKLILETVQPIDTETREGKTKPTFMLPSKPGKTVEKEVTLTSSLMMGYPIGSDIWCKLSQGSMSCHGLMVTDTPTLPNNTDFVMAIAKVVGADATYNRELVVTRAGGTSYDSDPAVLTYFGIRRAKADGSIIVVGLLRITSENYGGSIFGEKNLMTWDGTYYPISNAWTMAKDNYSAGTHIDNMGTDLSVQRSTAMDNWEYDQAYNYSNSTSCYPNHYAIRNSKFGYYSIEKASN